MESMVLAISFAWTVVFLAASVANGGRLGCPSRVLTLPCLCQEKSKGLDISCENTRPDQLRESLENIGQTKQTIVYLKIRNNNMETVPGFLFVGLDVRHVIVVNSNIAEIEDSAFTGLAEKMETLDLAQNALERVPTTALEGLTSLVSLTLNYNKIQVLHSEAFKGLISLLRLSLYGNMIKVIDDNAFHGVGGNLTRINFGANELTVVPFRALRRLTVLQRLQLRENRITSLVPNEFNGMNESLDMLDLAANQLEELPERAFSNLSLLNSLDLEGNMIHTIHPNAFKGLEGSLEWLKMGENRLDVIPSYALRSLVKLRQLDLRNNEISKITDDSFTPYGNNLKFIYLQKNGLQTIEPKALVELDSLQWLYLQSNQITSIPYETFEPVLDTLQVLDIHDNPFYCDCKISWFRDWLMGAGSQVVSMPRETRCQTTKEIDRLPILDIPSSQLACKSSAKAVISAKGSTSANQHYPENSPSITPFIQRVLWHQQRHISASTETRKNAFHRMHHRLSYRRPVIRRKPLLVKTTTGWRRTWTAEMLRGSDIWRTMVYNEEYQFQKFKCMKSWRRRTKNSNHLVPRKCIYNTAVYDIVVNNDRHSMLDTLLS